MPDLDVWGKLWDLCMPVGSGEPARIEVDPEDSGRVTLVWPDGSKGAWYWHDGNWQAAEPSTYDIGHGIPGRCM